MTDFRFANPEWMHATWVVLATAALLVFLELRGRSVLDQFLSKIMQSRLAHSVSTTRRLITIAFISSSMLLMVMSLMQPQWGRTVQSVTRVESQLMICLDVSRSMLAEDVAPNRLERAKVELDALLGLMDQGQQVGLIEFAGKATVQCPMTTDFGFLRLILNEARPENIGLKGTRIGDALQRAVAGFGEAGDINRLIMLLTDGEDHDSFPVEVAAAAREKGIKIISIGFGDESGSKIEITDPNTGARSFVKNSEGVDVISRLDGETLRDIAVETEGAYIPAGTGALDLESIYNGHIKSLLSGSAQDEKRIIRNEAFQWPLLSALAMLVFGLFVSTPLRLRDQAARAGDWSTTPQKTAAIILLALFAGTLAIPVHAQTQSPDPIQNTDASISKELPSNTDDENSDAGNADSVSETKPPKPLETIPEDITPRDAYNQALPFVNSNPDRAEQFLNRARRDAGVDGEVRFRSLYNLGWVEISRADQQLEKEPKQALSHLENAANRFREAIRVRPDSVEARHNLEVVSRRILELSDSLNKKDPRDLAARLDELIKQIRAHRSELSQLAQQDENMNDSVRASDRRKPFRQLGIGQRQIISDMQKFSDDARQQIDAINAKKTEEQTDEEKLQVVQVGNMLAHLDSGLQRMNQARSQTRRMQAVRGFQRWSSGLTDAKRARDQLRNPVEIIGQLIGDAIELNQLTQRSHEARNDLLGTAQRSQSPIWLTDEYLLESQTAIDQRTSELNQVLSQMVAAPPEQPDTPPQNPDPQQAETERLLENIRQSLPIMESAHNEFTSSTSKIAATEITAAIEHQIAAINYLNDAWELFFDIRRMIEAIYRDENIISSGIQTAIDQPALSDQIAFAILEPQKKNLDRCVRLEQLLNQELEKANQTEGPVNPTAPNDATDSEAANQQAAEKQRLEQAKQILEQIISELNSANNSLTAASTKKPDPTNSDTTPNANAAPPTNSNTDESSKDQQQGVSDDSDAGSNKSDLNSDENAIQKSDPDSNAENENNTSPSPKDSDAPKKSPELTAAAKHTETAIDKLEELRRLFFSLVEHLRDTAKRQSNLNDETGEQSDNIETDSDTERAQKTGPLATRQQTLQSISDQIAKALNKQSEQAAAGGPQPTPGQPSPEQAAEAAKKLAEAAGFVDQAQSEMTSALEHLNGIVDSQSRSNSSESNTSPTGDPEPPTTDDSESPDEVEPAESNSSETEKGNESQGPKHQLAQATVSQQQALEHLLKALELLDQKNDQNQEQDQQQNQDQQQQPNEPQQNEQQQQQEMNAQQLLQLIRDREAERRKNKQKRPAKAIPGDKDW